MKAAVCAALGLMLVVMAEGQFAPDLPVNIINVEMYIPDLDLDQRPGLLDPTSGDHANLTSEVKKAFSEYGGDVEQVLLSDGSGCVKVFVVWNIADNSALFSLTRQLQRDGLTVFGKTWDIRFDECKPAATLPPPDTEVINFEMHVPDLDPMSRPSLMNVTSADYTELNAAIVSFFSQYGGEIEDVYVSDGGACTKIFIVWQNANRDLWFQLSQELKTVGFQAFGQMWKVNFDGSCQHVMTTPSPSVVNLEIYIPGLDLATKPDLQNANTDDYWTFRNAITSAVMPFRGFVDEVLVSDGGGCAKVYLTVTDIEDRSVFRLQEALKNKGLTVFDRSWRLNFDGCADDYSVVELKLYLVGLQWSDAYNDRSSPEYMSAASLVKERFQALGGKLMNLELGQVNGCAELMVQWEATRHAAILDVILGLTDVTVALDNNYYKVQLRPCQPSQESTSSCPTLPPLTPCARDNCSTNAQCRSDYLCCDGCCMRVNYAVKFNASLVMDATFMPGYNTSTDVRFASLETSLTQWVRSAFTQTLSVSAGAELLGASPWFHKSRNVTRVHFSVFLEVDLGRPNLEEVADYLTVGDLAVEGTSYPILSVDIGRGGRCGRGHCPGRSCNGVWKEFLSGLQYCDCVAGYHGPRCDLFDCRADISQPDSPTNSLCHAEGGQCLQQNTSSSYKCQCNMGYMGKTCETRVCDYFPDDFCSGQGQCVADMKGGNLCKCQPGRGGLFCENQQEDNLTQCQRQRRLMQYVHGIVGWNSTASVAQRETLREFFRMSNHTEYLVPACWPVNDAHQGGYHSMCNYDVRSGYSRCYCTNSEGEPNYWHYAGHMDCRIYSSGGENMTFEMYLHNVTYNRTTMSRNSAIYRSVETAARDALSNYGGRPNNITFQPHAGMCVKVTIQWLSTAAGAITADVYQSMLDWLSREPINVGRAMAYLSPRPCPVPMDEDVCPDMSREESGLVGLCAFMCSEDSECPGQLNKCCKNPCGGTNCMEVGYQQKLKTSLSTQIPYTMAVTSSADGSVSLDARLNTTLVAMVDNMMRRYRVPHYRMSRVMGFRPADDTVQRRKRQVMEPTTTIDMELLFRGEVPVKKVLEMSQMLERVQIPYMGTNYSVSAVDSGDDENCPSKPCSSGSLCVTSLGGQRKCQCPMDKGGDYCENDVYPGRNMTFEMYLHNVTYNSTIMSRNSPTYRSVEAAVVSAFSNYPGRVYNITFQPQTAMCVNVTIHWLPQGTTPIPASIYQSMPEWLSREPINVGGVIAYLSRRPCPLPEDVCPDMSREESGLVGLCAFTCSEDSECPGQLNKCCTNPCGGTNCMEVGYQQKLRTSLSTQIPYIMAVTSSADGSVSLDARLNTTLVAMVDNMMRRYRVPHYRMSRVVGFRPADDTVQRRKRQAIQATTTVEMELLFRGEISAKDIEGTRPQLSNLQIPYMGRNYSVSAVDFGDEKNCPSKPCSSGSLCVTSLGGQRKCQCPMDKGGDYCENDVHLVEFKLYVLQLTWTRELQDPGSRRYMDWKTAVTSKLSGMGGKLVTLEFSSINSCVGMYVQWEATTDTAILSVITGLTSHPLGVAGMDYTVQTKPCPLTPTQGDDYVFSMSALVVIDMEFDPSILPTSPAYIMIDEIVQTEAPNAFRDVSSDVKVTARLRGLSPYRHKYMNLTALHVTAYLWKDLSYVELQKAKENLAATSFPNPGAEPLRAVHVEFGGHSGNGSFSACGNRRCNGVCKNFRTGQHVCACPTGYQGPLCDTFDCRTNMTSWPAPQVGHCQNGGMCRLDLEDSVFECECVPGYYGELCEVNVCDYMTEPCSQAGTCVGDVTSGELCRCEPGYAGLFCERRGTESLSDCEKERRLLLFAHQQVLGARQDPRLKIPMVSLLQEITSTFYTVPSCWPKDQAHDGGHHSFCEYNVTNGHQLDCFCTNVDGDRNGAHYVGHMDCRMYGTVRPVLKQGILYIPGLEYSDSLLDRASDLYKEIKEQISLILEPEVGGYLQKMFFIERAMCVRVTVNWMALERSRLKSVVTMLSGRSISLAGNTTTYSLSQKECLTAGQLDRCPRVPYDYESTLVGACEASSCRRDSDCHKGYKCCSAGCGNVTQCMIAGYLSKTQITLSTEIPFWADLYNSSSLLHRLVAYNISSLMDEVLKSKVVGYKMNKVLGFRPANSSSYRNDSYNNNNYNNNYNNSTYNNSTGGRNRRQALPATEVAVELYFISEVPVQQMLEVLEDVESSPIVIRGESYAVRRVRAGEEGPCPRDECSRGSVCAANISGNKYCACPVGRAGRRCEINECRVHQGGLACLNNGTCQFSNTYNDYRCDCPQGYQGLRCQYKFCDFVKPGACGRGECIGDVMDSVQLCRCPPGTGGMFCEKAGAENLTMCERQAQLTHYSIAVLNGSMIEEKLTIPMRDLQLMIDPVYFAAPICRDDGSYAAFCNYDIDTGNQLDCFCTDRYGMPNKWVMKGGVCSPNLIDPCYSSPCENNGTCTTLSHDHYFCNCPPGMTGRNCEQEDEGIQCRVGNPLTQGGRHRSCRQQPCPFGFVCQTERADRWTACCLDTGFLCRLDLCQNGGSCVGDFDTGRVCSCPTGWTGTFCDRQDAGDSRTPCQVRQEFTTWVISLLSGEELLPTGVSISDLRQLVYYLGWEGYVITDLCDAEGNYASVASAVMVANPEQEKMDVCMDRVGNVDLRCRAAVCEQLTMNNASLCQNGGRCHGDVGSRLCDCRWTGKHGVLCELDGERYNMTRCQGRLEIAHLALGILNGTVSAPLDNADLKRRLMGILKALDSDTVFVPLCSAEGEFLGSGCQHMASSPQSKLCYCATEDGEQVGESVSLLEAPRGCHGDVDPNERCRPEWGPDCKKPDWYCSEEAQCAPHQRCMVSYGCVGQANCQGHLNYTCVSKDYRFPCDPIPCKDNPYQKCPVCGAHAECINLMGNRHKANDNSNSDDDDDDKDKDMYRDHDDDDSEDKDTSWMGRLLGGGSGDEYKCLCHAGYSGDHCQVNDDICRAVPAGLCGRLGCEGRLEDGVLCRCPKGYGGLFCNRRARTKCERQRAMSEDAMDTMRGRLEMPGFDSRGVEDLVRALVNLAGDDNIMLPNCTEAGFYDKVQCVASLSNLEEKTCYCADHHGEYISSNIQPYIGYDTCTGPADYRYWNMCSNDLLEPFNETICRHRGECVFNPYEGKICDCLDGYTGLFCERQGNDTAEPESMCEMMSEAYRTARQLVLGEYPVVYNSGQWWGYVNMTFMWLFPNSNRTDHGFPREQVVLKPTCNADGSFHPVVCDHDIVTDTRIACYCWGAAGPVIATEAATPELTNCSRLEEACTELEACPNLKCAYGHQRNTLHCPICQCRNPCQDMRCGKGERCVLRKEKYCLIPDSPDKCVTPVCAPVKKPGSCPGHDVTTLGSIIGGGINMYSSIMDDNGRDKDDDDEDLYCDVTCADDADCQGRQKCCGLCGSRCVDPIDSLECPDKVQEHEQRMEMLRDAYQRIKRREEIPRLVLTTLDRMLEVNQTWVPKCAADSDRFAPRQCMYPVRNGQVVPNSSPTTCFCVDAFGQKIEGFGPNPMLCGVKPFTCPVLDSGEYVWEQTCDSDEHCEGGNKCCPVGNRMTCAEPVDTSKLVTTVDRILSQPDFCDKYGRYVCEDSSTCVGKWQSDGLLCACRETRAGPFCTEFISDMTLPPTTLCRRKKLAAGVFVSSLSTDPGNMSRFARILYEEMDQSMQELLRNNITMVHTECKADGEFEPTQCVQDLRSGAITHCFCVDKEGKELPGTRMSARRGRPFCGDDYRLCPVGDPLHTTNGDFASCGSTDNACPSGYTCKRSAYGSFYCCPTKEALKKVCQLPADPGMVCNGSNPGVQTRYTHDQLGQCSRFDYFGCAGNGNNFETVADCTKRCQNNIHLGTCPKMPVRVPGKGRCSDQCTSDADCERDSHKCCDSSCGRRCVPAGDKPDKPTSHHQCAIDVPVRQCQFPDQCPRGYVCNMTVGDTQGNCCLNATEGAIELCSVVPVSTEDCYEWTERYFHNATSSRCERFRFRGCQPGFNNFPSLEACCEACDRHGRCKDGVCPAVQQGVVVDSCNDECETDAECKGHKICCSNGCAKKCMHPEVEAVSSCRQRQLESKRSLAKEMMSSGECSLGYVPSCEKDGAWSRQQCQKKTGVCWCVTDQGHYVMDTLTRGVAPCGDLTPSQLSYADVMPVSMDNVNFPACTGGQAFHCCSEALCQRKCHRFPTAVCRINPCGGCQAHFYLDGRVVDCEAELSTCELAVSRAAKTIQERHITAMKMMDDQQMTGDNGMGKMWPKDKDDDMDDDDDDDEMMDMGMTRRSSVIVPGVPAFCHQLPETGPCKGYRKQWFYHPGSRQCSVFVWGMCGGNENRFNSPEECYRQCDPSESPCTRVKCSSNKPVCKLSYPDGCGLGERLCAVNATCVEREMPHLVEDVYIPRCVGVERVFRPKQCHGAYCWCVDDEGRYLGGFSDRVGGVPLKCEKQGQVAGTGDSLTNCPSGSAPNPNCINSCAGRVCPGKPLATCQVDLCSDDCATTFVDTSGAEVTCEENQCLAFSFDANSTVCPQPTLCGGGSDVRTCPDSVCEKATMEECGNNPCALCMVDPCTCRPYFVDMISGARLSRSQCQDLSLGVCEVRRCAEQKAIEKARQNDLTLEEEELVLSQCDATGGFEPRQCAGSLCFCVDEAGQSVAANPNGTCKAIDKVKEVNTTLTYNYDYDTLVSKNLVESFVEAVQAKFTEKGIAVKLGRPYRGSVKIDATITSDKNKDLSLVKTVVEQSVATSDMDLTVGGEQLSLIKEETVVKARTASQIGGGGDGGGGDGGGGTGGPVEEEKDGDSGLSHSEKVIIGCVCGGVGLLLLVVVVACCCHRQKKKQATPPVDDTYDHIRVQTVWPSEKDPKMSQYDNPPVYNQAFEPDNPYMKVRL